MSEAIEYLLNNASEAEIAKHLARCDADFIPPLSGRVEINCYAKKIMSKATRFEAWSGGVLIGLVAAYYNDQNSRMAFITSVSILREWTGKGITMQLMSQCIKRAKETGMRQISLKVASANTSAIKLYKKNGFVLGEAESPFVSMNRYLTSGEEHE